ncbi:hypothetical protein Brsp01_35230 [Brucella sp. NBRC 12950]|nr:hypothetical protein Brsp01_35230 [Brucella sp. NBRC 12950]
MGDELQEQEQGLWRRPGALSVGCGHPPGFEIGEIRVPCTQGVFSHAFFDQMTQRFDILIGQNLCQPVATAHRQDP